MEWVTHTLDLLYAPVFLIGVVAWIVFWCRGATAALKSMGVKDPALKAQYKKKRLKPIIFFAGIVLPVFIMSTVVQLQARKEAKALLAQNVISATVNNAPADTCSSLSAICAI